MNSQIQCPVCTLFLHAGMNLQDHLETHPKEKVIAALVNMTLLQQQANDSADINNFQCSRYEPLSLDAEPLPAPPATYGDSVHSQRKQITYYNTPEKQTQTRRVMIVNSRMSRVVSASSSIHENRSTRQNTIPKTTASSRIIHLIAADATNSSMSIPPPPPYNTAVPLDSTPSHASSSGYSIANPTADLIQQCFESSDTRGFGTSSFGRRKLASALVETPTKTIDLDAEHSSSSCSSSSTLCSSSSSSILSSSSKESVPAGLTLPSTSNAKQSKSMISNSKPIGELVVDCGHQDAASTSNHQMAGQADEDMVVDESCSVIHLNDGYAKEDESLTRNKFKRNADKSKAGFKVLSDVKLSPNTALNMSTLNSQLNETVNLNHMIVVGSSLHKTAKKQPNNSKSRSEESVPERKSSKEGPSQDVNVSNNRLYRCWKSIIWPDKFQIYLDLAGNESKASRHQVIVCRQRQG